MYNFATASSILFNFYALSFRNILPSVGTNSNKLSFPYHHILESKFRVNSQNKDNDLLPLYTNIKPTYTETKGDKSKVGKLVKTFLLLSVPLLFLNVDITSLHASMYSSDVQVSIVKDTNDVGRTFTLQSDSELTQLKSVHSNKKTKMSLNELFHTITTISLDVPSLKAPAPPQKLITTSPQTQDGADLTDTELNILENIRSTLVNMFDAIKEAYVVDNMNTFISISVAEGFSGIIAGLSSRKFADLLNDKKRDSLFTKLFSTGFFFGGRSFFRL